MTWLNTGIIHLTDVFLLTLLIDSDGEKPFLKTAFFNVKQRMIKKSCNFLITLFSDKIEFFSLLLQTPFDFQSIC